LTQIEAFGVNPSTASYTASLGVGLMACVEEGAHKQRVAVGLAFLTSTAPIRAGGTRLVVDDDLLARRRRAVRGHAADESVGPAGANGITSLIGFSGYWPAARTMDRTARVPEAGRKQMTTLLWSSVTY